MRHKPPDRRACWTQKSRIGGQAFYLSFGEFEDGSLCEIWITSSKEGTFTRGIMDSLARTISLALQCKLPISEIVKVLKGMKFPPDGAVTGSQTIQECDSIVDWIAKEIEAYYGEGNARESDIQELPSSQEDSSIV